MSDILTEYASRRKVDESIALVKNQATGEYKLSEAKGGIVKLSKDEVLIGPVTTPITAGHPRFLALARLIQETHERKAREYGSDRDPLQNINDARDMGIDPWRGALLRLNDKIRSMISYAKTGKEPDEGIEDTLIDIANYALITLVCWEQDEAKRVK